MKKFLIPALVTVIVLVCYFSIIEHKSSSTESIEFVVEKPYLVVAKGIATKNSLEKIVEQQEGVVKGKEWVKFEVEVPQRILRIKDYSLEGEMKFVVEKNDPSLGKLVLPFEQQINMDKNILKIKTKLCECNEKIQDCSRLIEITPQIDKESIHATNVKITSSLKVVKEIPFFLKSTMDQKVEENNKSELENTKNTIMSLTNDITPVISFKRK